MRLTGSPQRPPKSFFPTGLGRGSGRAENGGGKKRRRRLSLKLPFSLPFSLSHPLCRPQVSTTCLLPALSPPSLSLLAQHWERGAGAKAPGAMAEEAAKVPLR